MRRLAVHLIFGVAAAGAADGPTRLPAGITVHATPSGDVFADADGLTLYVFDQDSTPGTAACLDDCAKAWPPMKAAAESQPFDDCSLVNLPDGITQWSYKGKPLYRYAQELRPGWAMGDGGGLWNLALTSWQFPQRNSGRAAAGPPPEPPVNLPPSPGSVRGQRTVVGTVMADHRGMTLYVSDLDPKACAGACAGKYAPFAAPMAALPVGDWQIGTMTGSNRQWMYLSKPVYTCIDDQKPGDVTCETRGIGPWRAVRLTN